MKELVDEENALIEKKGAVPAEPVLRQAKLDGFSDRYLSQILGVSEEEVRTTREKYGICEAFSAAAPTESVRASSSITAVFTRRSH